MFHGHHVVWERNSEWKHHGLSMFQADPQDFGWTLCNCNSATHCEQVKSSIVSMLCSLKRSKCRCLSESRSLFPSQNPHRHKSSCKRAHRTYLPLSSEWVFWVFSFGPEKNRHKTLLHLKAYTHQTDRSCSDSRARKRRETSLSQMCQKCEIHTKMWGKRVVLAVHRLPLTNSCDFVNTCPKAIRKLFLKRLFILQKVY